MAAGGSFPVISGPAVSGPSMNAQVPPPPAPVLGQVASGALAATTYFCKLTFVTAQGETIPGGESSLAVNINNVPTVQSPAVPLGPQGTPIPVVSYNVYMSNTGGGGSGAETKQATVAIGTNYQLPNTGLVGGAAMPTSSTALVLGSSQPYGQPIPQLPLSGLGADNPGLQSSDGSGRSGRG